MVVRRIFAIGGHGSDGMLDQFIAKAGDNAHVAIVSHAQIEPAAAGQDLLDRLEGQVKVTLLLPNSSEVLPETTTAVYIMGGDQNRLLETCRQSGLDKQLLLAYERGVLTAGTSAGAAAMANQMIAGGMDDKLLRHASLLIRPGLGFLDGVVVDTHVDYYRRFNRLVAACAEVPEAIALGLDEDTAVYLEDRSAEVFGSGHVTTVCRLTDFRSNLKTAEPGTNATVENVRVAVYSAGDKFNLLNKQTGAD